MQKYLSITILIFLLTIIFSAFSWATVPLTALAVEFSSTGSNSSGPATQVPEEVYSDQILWEGEKNRITLVGQENISRERIRTPEVMILIPAGGYLAGGDPKTGYKECVKHAQSCELEWFEHEGPTSWVWIEKFYLDIYEVTQIDFEKVMGKNPSKYKGDNLPVERVLWNEAREYCEKIGKRLPTEAEWEKAAKGGGNTLYPWGNEVVSGMANFCDVNCKAYFKAEQFDDGFKGTAPVGSYPPNGYGLYDMAGNVWEWVSDWYGAGYYKERPQRNPQGPFNEQDLFHIHGMKKVLRGGSWGNNAGAMRSSTRSWAHNSRVSRRGFRCALDTTS
ncbi:MAG: formylglycine-generating enzyme family protein [Nitrospinaceae bacterium]